MEEIREEPLFVLNRVVVVVLPKAPLIDWVNHACSPQPAGLSLDLARADPNVFLIPTHADEFEAPGAQWLDEHWETLFERVLRDWSEDTTRWPQRRTKALFEQWCDVKTYSVVFDCSTQALQYSDA